MKLIWGCVCFYSNEKDLKDHLTDNGGLYDLIVKQMIQQGHEGELCSWLKESNLIRSNMNCPTEGCNGKSLQWSPARSIDKYCWYCADCKKRQNLREGSFFLQIKCDLKLCMQLIVAWCQSIPSEVVINHLSESYQLLFDFWARVLKLCRWRGS